MTTVRKARKAPQPKKKQVKLEVVRPKEPTWIPIDFAKVKTINDVKTILEHMSLGCWDNAPAYELLKKYLKYDE